MTYKHLIYAADSRVGVATLNRPQRLNALSSDLATELMDLLNVVEADESVGVLVITGASRPDGRPCFCAGADLKEMTEEGSSLSRNQNDVVRALEGMLSGDSTQIKQLFRRVERLGKPTIAAIDGVCTAGGLELALCCDLRYAATTAQISDLHIKNMRTIGAGIPTRLALTVGRANAKQLMFTGMPLNGEQALHIGLVNMVFPNTDLLPKTVEMARLIAGMDSNALRLAKAAIDATARLDSESALHYSYACNAALFSQSTPGAYAEKR